MEIKMYSSRWGELHFTDTFPSHMSHLFLPGASCKVATTAGNDYYFLFQQLEEEAITVRLYNFFSREASSFILFTGPMTTLRLAFSRTHQFQLPQLGVLQFYERSFNLLHLPYYSAEYSIGPNEPFVFWDIIISNEYLQSLEASFPVLTDFLQKAGNQVPGKLCMYNQVATTEIMRWIDELVHWNDANQKKRKKLSTIVQEIMELSLTAIEQKPVKKAIRLNPREIDIIYQAADLLCRFEKDYSAEELAKRFGISAYKLGKAFKQIYGHSVAHHQHEEKMRQALRLVHNKGHTMKEIAYMLDYLPQNFIRAFKNRFGYTPGRNAQE